MKRPPVGLCVPCRVVRVIDGDTVEIVAVTGLTWRVRLLDCWCHETNRGPERLRAKGAAAKAFAQECVDEARVCHVWVPSGEDLEELVAKGKSVNPLDLATFNRVLGHLFVSDEATLSELMVRAGHAFTTKEGLVTSEAASQRERPAEPSGASPSAAAARRRTA